MWVFGIFNNKDAAALTAFGLHALQQVVLFYLLSLNKNKSYLNPYNLDLSVRT